MRVRRWASGGRSDRIHFRFETDRSEFDNLSTGDRRRAGRLRFGERVTTNSPFAPRAGRPRSEQAHRAILTATLESLVEVGYSALTIEGVAQRASVGKATIYRRWASKLPLVIEAYGLLPQLEEVDTGSLVGDLNEMLHDYLQLLTSTPLRGVIPSIAGERAHNPELSELFDPIVRDRRRPLTAVQQRLAASCRRGSTSSWLRIFWSARSPRGCSSVPGSTPRWSSRWSKWPSGGWSAGARATSQAADGATPARPRPRGCHRSRPASRSFRACARTRRRHIQAVWQRHSRGGSRPDSPRSRRRTSGW